MSCFDFEVNYYLNKFKKTPQPTNNENKALKLLNNKQSESCCLADLYNN